MGTNKTGFLLIEALAALALCTLLSLLVAHYQTTILIWYHDGMRRLQALTIASNYSEQYHLDPLNLDPLNTDPTNQQDQFTVTRERLASNQAGFYLAKITVSWKTVQGKEEKIAWYTGAAPVGATNSGAGDSDTNSTSTSKESAGVTHDQ